MKPIFRNAATDNGDGESCSDMWDSAQPPFVKPSSITRYRPDCASPSRSQNRLRSPDEICLAHQCMLSRSGSSHRRTSTKISETQCTNVNTTRGQSNLTKSASPLNSWGRVSYWCSIVTIGLGCTVWPQCTRVTTNQPTTNDVTTQPISINASFTNVK